VRKSRRHLIEECEKYRRAWLDALDRLLYVHGDNYGRASSTADGSGGNSG
jgi:hypothetical protein